MAIVAQPMQDYPFFLQADASDTAINYTASDFRRMLGSILQREGVLTAASFWVYQTDNVGYSIKVTAGYAMVGNYLVHNQADIASISLTSFNTNPTSTRTHSVYLAVYDKQLRGTTYGAQIVVTEDTGAGAPAPDNTSGYLLLATVSIAHGQANIQNFNIVNRAPHGGAMSGTVLALADYLETGYESAASAIGSAPPRGFYSNAVGRLGGAIRRTSGDPFSAGGIYTVMTLPQSWRPAYTKYLTAACSVATTSAPGVTGTYSYRLMVEPSGAVTAAIPSTHAPDYLMFDGVTYELD